MTPLAETARQRLEDILTFFGVNTSVDAVQEDDTIRLTVDSDVSGQLIGHRGETLEALQHMLNMMMRRQTPERVYVHVDIGGYKKARLEKLEAKARELVSEVTESGEEATLPHMSPAERRHIHSIFSEDPVVTTESRGQGKARRLVIKPRDS